MEKLNSARRALIGGGLAASMIPTPAISMAPAPVTGVSIELSRLIKAHSNAEARRTRIYAEVIDPATKAYFEGVRRHKALVDGVPHVEESGGRAAGGDPVTFSSRTGYARSHAELCIARGLRHPNLGPDCQETIDAAHRYLLAEDRRKAALAAIGEAPPRPPVLGEQEAAANKPVREAREAVLTFPCRSIADLQAKLSFLEGNGGMDGEDLVPLVMTDLTRLAGGEA